MIRKKKKKILPQPDDHLEKDSTCLNETLHFLFSFIAKQINNPFFFLKITEQHVCRIIN